MYLQTIFSGAVASPNHSFYGEMNSIAPDPRDLPAPGNSVPKGISASNSVVRDLDKDGDGNIDEKELERFVQGHQIVLKERTMLRNFLIVLIGVLLVFAVVICAGTYVVIEMTKEIGVESDDNVLRGGKNDNMVVTDNPRYYTTLSDIPQLSPEALNALQRLSFVTRDGQSHNYMVQGIDPLALPFQFLIICSIFGRNENDNHFQSNNYNLLL
jgi:hypothetical protein